MGDPVSVRHPLIGLCTLALAVVLVAHLAAQCGIPL
jgi:hypothetical protein